MKKFIISAMAVLAISLSAFGFTACDDEPAGHAHTLVKHEAVAKTCTQAGSKLYWECSDCGKLFLDEQANNETTAEDVVIAAGHVEELLPGRLATCQQKGLSEGAKCSVCGTTIIEQIETDYDYSTHEYEVRHNETEHWYECACGEKKAPEAHSGGTATATQKARCELCGAEYGDFGTGGVLPTVPGPDYAGEKIKYTPNYTNVNVSGNAQKQTGNGEAGTFIGDIMSGDRIIYTIKSDEEAEVELSLSAAGALRQVEDWVGDTVEGAFSVYLNDSTEPIAVIDIGTNGYVNFRPIAIGNATLVAGTNTIVLVAGEDVNGNVNVDYLLVAPAIEHIYLGFKDAVVTNGGSVGESAIGYDGYRASISAKDATVAVTVTGIEGVYALSIYVEGGTFDWGWSDWSPKDDGQIEVEVNGEVIDTYNFKTPNWGVYLEFDFGTVSLDAGENTILLRNVSGSANIGWLKLDAQEIPADHEHALVEHEASEPTCTDPGNIHYWKCSGCKKNFTSEDATEEISVVKIPANGHTKETVEGYAATCTEAGLSDGTKCSVCKETLVEREEIPALGHTYVTNCKWTESEEDGYTALMEFTCSECDIAAQEVPAVVTSETTDATCTEDGEIVYTAKATLEGNEYTETKSVVLHATGHTYDREIISSKYLKEGNTYYKSCKCGEYDPEGETFTVMPHDLTKVDAKTPTCEEDGNVEHWLCSICNKKFTSEEGIEEIGDVIITATGHTYNDPDWSWTDENVSATATFICTICDDEKVVDATITSETTDSTCAEKGNTTYTATITLAGKQYTDQKVVELALADHEWATEWSTDNDNHWHACINCDEKKDSGKHTGGTATPEERAECEVCGAEYGKLLSSYNGEELVLEAEEADLTGKCKVERNYVAGLQNGDTITFTFYSQSEKNVELLLAIANGGSNADKAFNVTITGEESFYMDVETVVSGGWTTFGERHAAYLTLSANTQYTVKFEVWKTNGALNLDYLKIIPWDGVEPKPPTPVEDELPAYNGTELFLQAEEAEVSGCNTQGNFVGGLSTGGSLTFKFKSEVEQDVELILSYANGNPPIEKLFRVIINEDDPFTLDAETIVSGGWTNFAERTVAGYKLKANTNYTVKFVVYNAGGVNIDYFKIVPWTNGDVVLPTPEERPAYNGEAALVLQAGTDASIKGEHNLSNGTIGGLASGSELTFKFKSSVSGKVELVLVASTSAQDITFDVTLNETSLTPVTITLTDNLVYELDLVADTNYTVVFTAGENVRNNVNITALKVVPYVAYTQDSLPLTYGAADVNTLNGCDHQSHGAGYQGQIVGNINQPGRGIMITVNAQGEINAHLTVYTDGNGGSSVTIEVFVNGESAGTCTYTANGWTQFLERDAGNITLQDGKNTIEVKVVEGQMNFSHLIMSAIVEGSETDETEAD